MTSAAKKLLIGSGMRFISLMITIGISFIMMPYLIHKLTDHWYGLWTVIGSLLGFYGLLDVGLSAATQRYIARAMPNNDPRELNSIVNTSLAIFSIIGSIAFLLTLIIAMLGGYFVDDPDELFIFRWVVVISGSGIAINFLFWVLFGVIMGKLRYDVMEYIQISKTVIRAILIYVFLEAGYSIIAMAVITVSLDLLAYLILLVFTKKIAPWLEVGFQYIDKSLAPKLFHFGKYSFVISVCEQIRNRTDNLLIPIYLTLSHVTHYAVAIRISGYFTQALVSLISVTTPVYAKLHAEKNEEKLINEFMRDTRFATILCCLGYGCIVLVSKVFIGLWLGEEYLDAYMPLIILTCSIFLIGIQIPAGNLQVAMNKHSSYAYMCVAEITCNVIFTLILLPKYGLIGAAIGTVTPLLISRVIVQPLLIFRIISLKPVFYYCQIIKIIVGLFTLQAGAYFVIPKIIQPDSYLDIFFILLLVYPVILILIYFLFLKENERKFLMTIIKRN